MRAPPPHEMVHEGTDASGMEEWRCPVCGRHFIVRWPPDYERLVLAEGDPKAVHVGTKEGEDAWRRWLDEHGIDWDDPDP